MWTQKQTHRYSVVRMCFLGQKSMREMASIHVEGICTDRLFIVLESFFWSFQFSSPRVCLGKEKRKIQINYNVTQRSSYLRQGPTVSPPIQSSRASWHTNRDISSFNIPDFYVFFHQINAVILWKLVKMLWGKCWNLFWIVFLHKPSDKQPDRGKNITCLVEMIDVIES